MQDQQHGNAKKPTEDHRQHRMVAGELHHDGFAARNGEEQTNELHDEIDRKQVLHRPGLHHTPHTKDRLQQLRIAFDEAALDGRD